ncbi:hypothetical protein FY036_00620 [Mesorhizobium microcysteis]|uniref:HTH luxR-type domain-containing protein n=1 Tax=Neoaquamicrobium microcysteis TaxID=2682781 RepID=A0A5D4HA90_9HYPH|nr:hypothetical protein [Mesorhizobium microcysteis]TYR36759.1 hypothetical protein FY036_00620 [Mesorhizobium microcysteis]
MRGAAWGHEAWVEACRRLADALPGSSPAILNYDMPRQQVNAAFFQGMAPDYVASYREHYMSVNPWIDYWTTVQAGTVHISEREMPSASFQKSEFYVDWLAPHGEIEAAVGMRLDVDPNNTVHLAWHYGLAHAETYDEAASAILELIGPDLADAVRVAASLRQGVESGAGLAGLMDRLDGAALLVERDRQIREANADAAIAMRQGDVVVAAGNTLSFRDAAAQRWLEDVVARLADGLPIASPSHVFRVQERVFRLTATPAPRHSEASLALLMQPRPLVLVTMKLLVGARSQIDDVGLRFTFGLSAAEIKLCEALANGHSLSEAARLLGVSDGTVRQRVKVIFNKTGTHRQGELIAMLGRFLLAG